MDRSLDEFLAGEERETDTDAHDTVDAADTTDSTNAADAEEDAENDETGAPEGASDPPDAATEVAGDEEAPALTVHPAESTMDWTPGGAACAACGSTVERRWRDDGELVCLGCKTW